MWPATDAGNVPGGNSPANNEHSSPSASAVALLERLLATPFSDWPVARDDIQQEIYRHLADRRINPAEFGQLTDFVHKRDQDVSQSGRTPSRSIGQRVNAAVRFSRAVARANGNLPRGSAPRKVLTEAERRERREKQGKRIYLAKVSIIAAEILQETRYPIAIQAVLARIVREVRNTGVCERAVGTLAQESGASRRTVQMALRRAEEDGLIAVQARPRKPNRITIINKQWLAWIANSINRDAERIGNYGVSSKGAEICALSDDHHTGLSCEQEVIARRPEPNRESGQASMPPRQSRPDTTNPQVEGHGAEPFEERLAQLERSVLAHSLFAARPTAEAIEELEQGSPQPTSANTDKSERGAGEVEVNAMLVADGE